MPHLLVYPPGELPFSVELRDGARIGRQGDSDVALVDPKASRRHASVQRVEEGWLLVDEGSRHGTLVNGEPIARKVLCEGDQIQIGEVVLVVSERDGAGDVVLTRPTEPQAAANGPAARLRVFYEVAAAIGEIEDPDALLGRMLEGILEVLGGERGVAGLLGVGGIRQVARRRSGARDGDIVVARGLLDAMLLRRESVIVREAAQTGTLAREGVTSAMGVPLVAGQRLLGLLYVDDRAAAGRFTEDDLAFLGALGHLTAAALASAERVRQRAAEEAAAAGDRALEQLVGESEAIRRLHATIRRCAGSNAHVLVRGESGTGKELVARALHALSPRGERAFVPVNSAAIPESMIESELFGHVRGAFTGALRDRRGRFALAHRGTLFLDEIGDLGLPAQAKLLRAVQDGEVQPVGADGVERVDVRVIAATHKDLLAEVRAGRFREDLYYRLAVVEVEVPPLRERGEDVAILARTFVGAAAERAKKPVAGLSPEALQALRAHDWPGNVRELQNECERAVLLSEGPFVDLTGLRAGVRASLARSGPASEDGRPPPRGGSQPPSGASLAERFARLAPAERGLVEEALAAARGNLSEAARLLGISRIMMRRRAARFGLTGRDD